MKIYLVRHGETEFNRMGIVQGSGVDTDLNQTGLEQARAFYEFYKDSGFDLVVTSDLRRTRQTVAGFIDQSIPWIKTADINEISWGEHEGKQSTPERLAIYEWMVGEWKNGNYHASLPGGETAKELGERLHRFIDWLHTNPAENMLVCTHGRTMRALVTLLKGLPLSEMESVPHSNTGCYIAHIQDGIVKFELENTVAHLENIPIF